MSKLKRELLNILFIGAGASLIHAAYEAANAKFNPLVWAVIVMGIAVALGGYVVFEHMLTADERITDLASGAAERETEWLKRVGTPARLDPVDEGKYIALLRATLRSLKPGSDVTVMVHIPRQARGLAAFHEFAGSTAETRLREFFGELLESVDNGILREYRRIICFEPDIFAQSQDLQSGVLRVGSGAAAAWKLLADHCRAMSSRKNCSVYVAPAIVQNDAFLFGADNAALTLRRFDPESGLIKQAYGFLFCDPPNREIIDELQQIVRDIEKGMVAVRSIVDQAEPAAATS